ncbi:F-box protein [Legionella lansingensis]|uniref:F-box protein n=1 Tax=Legionella lansingensis TaxID=45067 RepID=A0A0W0VKP1_9GAMM|nr:F-box-like domain-containing protein [Legionella lansingensis]KTD20393.1 F-box protein [Legionella lansingensis]SNV51584.1 F-box protein [Legionella lansingensis]
MSFYTLPEETLLGIFKLLNTKTLARTAQTCHFFNRLANDKTLDLAKGKQARLKNQLRGDLMVAARHNDLDTVKTILAKDIIDPTDASTSIVGKTPLHAALEGRAYKTAAYLWRNYSFDPNLKDYYQSSPISILQERSRKMGLTPKERKQIESLLTLMTENQAGCHKCIVS